MPPNECPKESDLLRQNRLFRTVSEINKITPGSLSELQYIENICRIATNTGGFLIAWVGLLHADRTLRAVAVAGKAKDYVEGLALSADPALPEGNGPTGRALRTRSPVITNDFLTNPMTHLWHERASHYGIACSAALPLYVGEDVVGIFMRIRRRGPSARGRRSGLAHAPVGGHCIRPAIHRACRDPGEIGKGAGIHGRTAQRH
jgi:GAF domain-containing protein